MSIFLYIIVFNLIGSVISLVGGLLLLVKKELAYKMSHFLASFAAGTLLGTVFFDLFPESLHEAEESGAGIEAILFYVLGGILFFFLLERVLHWFHHHGYEEHIIKGKPVIPLLIVGDAIHNFVDGVAIAAAFIVNIPAGIVTTLAVGLHEIPQEIGDFGIMLKHKLSRKRIVLINLLCASTSFLGAIGAYYYASNIEGLSLFFVSVASGFFLYIALSDIIPEIHHEGKRKIALVETLALFVGVLTVLVALFLVETFFGLEH